MLNDGELWDPATVIGLRSSDQVLVVGNGAFMPWIAETCNDVMSLSKHGELKLAATDMVQFDKVIIARETPFSAELIPLAAKLVRAGGLLCAFTTGDGWEFDRAVDFYYPETSVITSDSLFGSVKITNARGLSWREYV